MYVWVGGQLLKFGNHWDKGTRVELNILWCVSRRDADGLQGGQLLYAESSCMLPYPSYVEHDDIVTVRL